ncbi:MAG: sulfatase-like hydrolase/transferase [Opitutaceae bacterium]|nr:sulfatase-like hydrolase/transferase [Opitutaceae bacterium]
MKRRDFLKSAGMGAAAMKLPMERLMAAQQAQTGKTPNVLMIAIDDLNHWVGYLGRNSQVKTPNIDNLAAQGVWFKHSYCAAPLCNPSRTALMSGMRPSTSGIYDNLIDWRTGVTADQSLNVQFRKAGYGVYGVGKIYHGYYFRPEDWDDYPRTFVGDPRPTKPDSIGNGMPLAKLDCNDEDMQDYRFVDYGIQQLQKKHDKPFFLAVGLRKPHFPWCVPQKYYNMYPLDKIDLPPYLADDLNDIPQAGVNLALSEPDHELIQKSGRWKEGLQAYLATVTFCDAMVGRLMDAFNKSQYKDNTIICFWSDHGFSLGEKHHWRKCALWEEETRVPMIWVVPGMKPGRCDRTVDNMSIYPTLLDLCGIPTPAHVEGESIKRLLVDPKAPWDRPAITTFQFNNHAVRSERWRYIRYNNGDEELYDETKDEYEWTNLVSNPKHAAQKAALAKWLPKTNTLPLPERAASATSKQ